MHGDGELQGADGMQPAGWALSAPCAGSLEAQTNRIHLRRQPPHNSASARFNQSTTRPRANNRFPPQLRARPLGARPHCGQLDPGSCDFTSCKRPFRHVHSCMHVPSGRICAASALHAGKLARGHACAHAVSWMMMHAACMHCALILTRCTR